MILLSAYLVLEVGGCVSGNCWKMSMVWWGKRDDGGLLELGDLGEVGCHVGRGGGRC